MNRIRYHLAAGARTLGCSDAAIVLADEDPREALVESVIQSIETDVQVTLGGVTIHLAALRDPAHWEEDWQELDIYDADAFIAGLATAEAPA